MIDIARHAVTNRKILGLIVAVATVVILLLFYNSYYRSTSHNGVGLPGVTDHGQ